MIRRLSELANPVLIARTLSLLVFLAAWEAAARWLIDPQFISPPSTVIARVPYLLADPGVRGAIVMTLGELAMAFALSVVIGCVIGIPIGLSRFGYRTAFPIMLLLYAIPQVTILPLFVLYLGLGVTTKIAFGVSHGMFPMMLNVVAGIRSVPQQHFVTARSMGATRVQMLRRVLFPHIAPNIFTGMRLAMSVTLLGVMLAELYVSTAGIGYYTQLYSSEFNSTNLLSLITMLAFMAIVLNESVRVLERHFCRWRDSQ